MSARKIKSGLLFVALCSLIPLFQNFSGGETWLTLTSNVKVPRQLSREVINSKTCTQLRSYYSVTSDNSGVVGKDNIHISKNLNFSRMQPIAALSCEAAERQFVVSNPTLGYREWKISQSVRLTSACNFEKVGIVITKGDIFFDGNGSTFKGGFIPSTPSPAGMSFGLSFEMNEDRNASAERQEPIRNVAIRSVRFQGYLTSGVFISNRFNRNLSNDVNFYNGILKTKMFDRGVFDTYMKPSPADKIRDLSPRNIMLENVWVSDTLNSGIYVQSMVSQVEMKNVDVRRTGSSAVYLDHGSRDILIHNSCFVEGGYYERKDSESGARRGYPSTDEIRREGIAVDASAGNAIRNNLFLNNGGGGVHLYKNAWEQAHNNPLGVAGPLKDQKVLPQGANLKYSAQAQFPRMQPSNYNMISNNIIVGGRIGVALGMRQMMAIDPDLNCRDNPLGRVTRQGGFRGRSIFRDYASSNKVERNVFIGVKTGIQMNDNGNIVDDNRFFVQPGLPNDSEFILNTSQRFELSDTTIKNDFISLDRASFRGNRAFGYSVANGLNGSFDLAHSTAGQLAWARNYVNGQVLSLNLQIWNFEGCKLPIYIRASNDSKKSCRFSGPTDLASGSYTRIRDGGNIYGDVNLYCRAGRIRVSEGFCCSGAHCERSARQAATEDILDISGSDE